MTRRARLVLLGLQGVVLGLPLFLGGRQPAALTVAWTVVMALLLVTLHERRHAGRPTPPGAWWLVAFMALGLFTAMPLPPWLIERLAPATAALYRDVLPGWPEGGGWTVWRSLAWDPYAVWWQLSTLAVGLGAYVVLAGYPWGDDQARVRAFGRMLLTVLGGGVAMALLALAQEVMGNGYVFWLSDEPSLPGRVSGPFVNPNHLAVWLEMLIPAGFAYAWVITGRLWRRIRRGVESGRNLGLKPRRAWVGALVNNQRRLALPFLVLAGVFLMLAAHAGTDSRGGTAALVVGLGVALGGLATRFSRRRVGALARWLPAAVLAAAFAGGVASLAAWSTVEQAVMEGNESLDASFSARLALSAQGTAILRDHPVFGTGLGSWLHAFRPYAAPPIGGLIWDHAHDDYVELAAETGLAGVAIVVLFGLSLLGTVRRSRRRAALDEARRTRRSHGGFDLPDWWSALGDQSALRWGLAGGVVAILVHSVVDFGLHMPGNFLLLTVVLGLIALALPVRESRTSLAPLAFATLAGVAAAPLALNAVRLATGGMPLSPDDALELADLARAEDDDMARAEALTVYAIDRAPASRDAHEQLAAVLGHGPAGDEALRRAIRLEPWYVPARDALALGLWQRGEREAALAELEESFARFPAFSWHAFLAPEIASGATKSRDLIRALAAGDAMTVQLADLDPAIAAAIERGFDRALANPPAGASRSRIVTDRIALLEARGRWADAADALVAEAQLDDLDDQSLGRAARNYLTAGDPARAEQALLAALARNPERGSLYKRLAVEIYGARGDFALAEQVLAAGERNAVDLMPVYDASAAVIAKREQAWTERLSKPSKETPK